MTSSSATEVRHLGPGHYASTCWNDPFCYSCKKFRHKSSKCQNKYRVNDGSGGSGYYGETRNLEKSNNSFNNDRGASRGKPSGRGVANNNKRGIFSNSQ